VSILREAGAFLRRKFASRVGAMAISNLYKTEQILISHLSSIVVEGSAYPTPFRADRTGDSGYGAHVKSDSGRSPL
jgi:hypothetical protein